jgi:predicted anti-sigma-YlaC factor YlaD
VNDPAPREAGLSAGGSSLTADEVTCEQFVELMTDYFEGALAPRTIGQIEEHLVMCDWCVTYMEQMRLTIASLRDLREAASAQPRPALLAAVRERGKTGG